MLKNKLIMVGLLVLGWEVMAKEPVVSDPVAIVKVAPQYPRVALMAKVEGWVTIVMSINKEGSVDHVEIEDSLPNRIFDEVSIDAGMKFKFIPKTIDGKPVPSKAKITLQFEVPEEPKMEEEASSDGISPSPLL